MTEQATAGTASAVDSPSTSSGWGAELRATFALAWPLVIAQLAQNALTTTDVIMLGWLGPSYLAAGALATSIFFAFLVFGTGIVGAVAPLAAQARGARNIKAVRRIARQGLWVALILGAVMVPVLLQVGTIFTLTGRNPATTVLVEQFMQIVAWSVFPALGIIVLRSLLSAFDATRIILMITLAGVVFNALANYLLIFGNFGFPRMELRGSALATLLSNIVMFSLMLAYVLRHRRFRRFHILLRFNRPDWPRFREIFRIGTPIGFTLLAEVSLFTAAAILMEQLGTDEMAAHAVALQCASMAFMIPLGLGIAASVRVGRAHGRGDPEGIAMAGWTAFCLAMAFMVFSCLLFLTAGPVIAGLFLDPSKPQNAHSLTLAASFLVIAGLFQLVDGAQVIAANALRGLSDTKIPMLLAIVGYWIIGLPIAYVLGFILDWRGIGIWIGLAAGLAFAAVVLVARFAMRERLGLVRLSA